MYSAQISPERKLKLCALPTCRGNRYDLVHKFPMNNERAQQWIDAIGMPELRKMPVDKVRKKYFICSKHFRPQDYKNCESRSLNTTAYPRLNLKTNGDELSDHCSPNMETGVEEMRLQDYELDAPEISLEIPEAESKDSSSTTTTAKEINIKAPIQYIVCSATSNVPLLLRRNRINDPDIAIQKSTQTQIATKQIPIKSVEKDIGNANNTFGRNSQLGKVAVKRNTNQTLESARKKHHLNEFEKASEVNKVSDEHSGMIALKHSSLRSPFNVCCFWLRDHCRCSECYGETSQRKHNITDIPIDIEPDELNTDNSTVRITWSDGHKSVYDILGLHGQLNAKPSPNRLKPIFWSAADIVCSDYANVTLNDYLCNDEVAKDVVASLVKFGCAFIKHVPANLQSTEIAVRRLFPIQKTHFGEMWSFSDNKARNDTAYTDEALPPHNDNTYFTDPAGLQILHCISRTCEGGETLLVDGLHVLKELREHNNEAFECLSQISIPSEYIEDGYHFKHCAPVIILDPVTGEPNQIRFNMNDRAFFNTLPQEEMLQFYKHYAELAKNLQSEKNKWHFQLEPGTVCIFDNWRLLHGRTEFTGRRHMVGCYVARSEFQSVARRYGMIS